MIEDDANEDWRGFGEMLRVNSRAEGRGDYWVWKNKRQGEASAAKQVLTDAGHQIVGLRARGEGQDPPDCEAMIDGQRCGIEVSELLDQDTLEHFIQGGTGEPFSWQPEDLYSALQNRIDRKDCPTELKGGPYERYFLVIVTDEPFLDRESVEQFLAGATFQTHLITDAYLALSFHPELGGKGSCPIFKLALTPRLSDQRVGDTFTAGGR
jgi:hypothetical protein